MIGGVCVGGPARDCVDGNPDPDAPTQHGVGVVYERVSQQMTPELRALFTMTELGGVTRRAAPSPR